MTLKGCDPLALIFHEYMPIFASYPRDILMWYPLILAYDARDDGGCKLDFY